jgi:hypothetical protein
MTGRSRRSAPRLDSVRPWSARRGRWWRRSSSPRGLVRGAYIGTEAAAAVVMHLTNLVVFGAAAVLTVRSGMIGLALPPAAAAGAWLGKRIVDRLSVAVFITVVEVGLGAAGLLLLLGGG